MHSTSRTAARALRALTGLAVLTGSVGLTGAAGAAEAATGPTTYYFSPTGLDSNAGTSSAAPKRSLSTIASLPLRPGDSVRLKAGSRFLGTAGVVLTASGTRSAPITLGSYGTGAPAVVDGSTDSCFSVRGSFVNVTTLKAAGCTWSGFSVSGSNVNLDRVEATSSYSGAQFEASSVYGSITNSNVHDNRRMKLLALGADDDSGAFGVLVLGTHTLIRDNRITGQDSLSLDYGRDGAAVEVFGADDTTVERNTVAGNQTFVEVGGVPGSNEVQGVTLSGNTVTASAPRTYGAVVHAGNQFGTARGVRVVGNSIALTGAGSLGVVCGPSCTPTVLALVGNRISAAGGNVVVQGSYATS